MTRKLRWMIEKGFRFFLYFFCFISLVILGFIMFFIVKESLSIFKEISFIDFLFTKGWKPLAEPIKLGILPMILASLYVSLLALLISLPLGVGMAIFLSVIMDQRKRKVCKPMIDLLAGIPSVVYGFFGLLVIVKFMEVNFSFSTGESVLSAGILLSIMILPYIISTYDESMIKVINNYQVSSNALGVSKWHMVRFLILPGTLSAIISAGILGLSRAMGETMAVMMVIGNTPLYPRLLGKAQTIPTLIALEMGGAQVDSMHYHALFAAGFVLMLLLFVINIIFYFLRKTYLELN